MRLPRLVAAALTAAALTPPAAWGQGDAVNAKQDYKQLSGGADKKPIDEEYAAMMKKKLLACKKSGDCKPYLLEKEKAKNKKDKEELSGGEPGGAPVQPAPAGPVASEEGEASPPPGAPSPTAEQAEVTRQEAAGRSERTMSRAAAAAETLRRSLRPDEEVGAQGAGGPERRAASTPDSPRNASAPSAPLSVPEMALAARAGFAATFRDQGLTVGAGPRGEPAIQRADGSPASAPELERLSAALSAEPAALIRRPDFFEALPRENFAELKRDFAERPALRSTVFKDIGMTDRGRDFQWSSSCSGLSGVCNPHANAGSYRKGQDVPPEDLKEVWKAAHEEMSEAEEEFGEYSDEDRRLAEAEDLAAEKLGSGRRQPTNLSALLARMGEMARGLGDRAGLDSYSSTPAGGPSRGGQAVGAEAQASLAGRLGDARGPGAGAAPSAPAHWPKANQPPAPEGRRTAESRNWIYVLAAAAAAGLLLRGLRKKP